MSTKKDEKLLDHNYDGIQELDNPLPRWWVYLFLGTVLFSIGYFGAHTLGYAKSIDSKFHTQLKEIQGTSKSEKSDAPVLAFDKTTENLSKGKEVFDLRCAACHRADGGGMVGPNLTDAYWLHGGSSQEIYNTVFNGVPAKGMLAWGPILKPEEIVSVVVYIQSLKGSHPANPKDPEGEKVE